MEMSIDVRDVYFNKLFNLLQLSTVEKYEQHFNLLHTQVVEKYWYIAESYFVNCCIEGFIEEIREFVKLCSPSSLESCFRLARMKERLINFVAASYVESEASNEVISSFNCVESTSVVPSITNVQTICKSNVSPSTMVIKAVEYDDSVNVINTDVEIKPIEVDEYAFDKSNDGDYILTLPKSNEISAIMVRETIQDYESINSTVTVESIKDDDSSEDRESDVLLVQNGWSQNLVVPSPHHNILAFKGGTVRGSSGEPSAVRNCYDSFRGSSANISAFIMQSKLTPDNSKMSWQNVGNYLNSRHLSLAVVIWGPLRVLAFFHKEFGCYSLIAPHSNWNCEPGPFLFMREQTEVLLHLQLEAAKRVSVFIEGYTQQLEMGSINHIHAEDETTTQQEDGTDQVIPRQSIFIWERGPFYSVGKRAANGETISEQSLTTNFRKYPVAFYCLDSQHGRYVINLQLSKRSSVSSIHRQVRENAARGFQAVFLCEASLASGGTWLAYIQDIAGCVVIFMSIQILHPCCNVMLLPIMKIWRLLLYDFCECIEYPIQVKTCFAKSLPVYSSLWTIGTVLAINILHGHIYHIMVSIQQDYSQPVTVHMNQSIYFFLIQNTYGELNRCKKSLASYLPSILRWLIHCLYAHGSWSLFTMVNFYVYLVLECSACAFIISSRATVWQILWVASACVGDFFKKCLTGKCLIVLNMQLCSACMENRITRANTANTRDSNRYNLCSKTRKSVMALSVCRNSQMESSSSSSGFRWFISWNSLQYGQQLLPAAGQLFSLFGYFLHAEEYTLKNTSTALFLTPEDGQLLWEPDPGIHPVIHCVQLVSAYPMAPVTEGFCQEQYYVRVTCISMCLFSDKCCASPPMISQDISVRVARWCILLVENSFWYQLRRSIFTQMILWITIKAATVQFTSVCSLYPTEHDMAIAQVIRHQMDVWTPSVLATMEVFRKDTVTLCMKSTETGLYAYINIVQVSMCLSSWSTHQVEVHRLAIQERPSPKVLISSDLPWRQLLIISIYPQSLKVEGGFWVLRSCRLVLVVYRSGVGQNYVHYQEMILPLLVRILVAAVPFLIDKFVRVNYIQQEGIGTIVEKDYFYLEDVCVLCHERTQYIAIQSSWFLEAHQGSICGTLFVFYYTRMASLSHTCPFG